MSKKIAEELRKFTTLVFYSHNLIHMRLHLTDVMFELPQNNKLQILHKFFVNIPSEQVLYIYEEYFGKCLL